ncbi:hypothetical protein FEE95_05650 [Maribacter algarum]|uniref:ATP synthase protein I n=1 Tax=Maribacter algarum (ex Zhang et al. 2020) TaxID=2578118 RepID=A0A5S3PV78_9FLAO|nr:DUF6168 family protein [Maribacter algarum]TMM58916.1 hypothetical protein FEE95_05650 [Maribacter algarum]
MPKNNVIVRFLVLLVCSLGLAFFIHITLLENVGHPKYNNKIVLSYLINAILATVIFVSLYIYRNKLQNYIGFLFMAGSFLKFIFFFIVFYPSYKLDGDMSRLEFAAFFIPYAICLVLETVFTAKMLQKLD